MLKRILGLVGWLGVALVFAAVAIRFLKPEYQQYYNGLAIAGLVCTLLYMAILFVYGNPEWRPLVAGYLGLLLMGGAFISIGLLISSTTNNQIVAGVVTFVVFLLFWIVGWFADSAGPTIGPITSWFSITEHFDDFSKGIIDTKHVIYYLSLITFGLFLSAKSVDTERWRG